MVALGGLRSCCLALQLQKPAVAVPPVCEAVHWMYSACREVVERGLPVLLAHNFSEGAPLAEQLQALPPPAMLALLAAVHAATRSCLTHRRR
jgi:hypothetical protein